MRRILITGGAGFVGSHLVERLLAGGWSVCSLDIAPHPELPRSSTSPVFRAVQGSIGDGPLLAGLLDDADVVCHLAGIATPSDYATRPREVMDVNLVHSLAVVGALRGRGKPLLYASTSEVYGRSPDVPFAEDGDRVLGSTAVHRWCYSASKGAVEHYIAACHAAGELDYVTVRLFNAYGPRLQGRVVDASQTRCFTWIGDVIDALVGLLATPGAWNTAYNVGSTEPVSVLELAGEVVRQVGALPIERVPYARVFGPRHEDIPQRVPRIDRLAAATGWSPSTPLAEGLARCLAARRASLESP